MLEAITGLTGNIIVVLLTLFGTMVGLFSEYTGKKSKTKAVTHGKRGAYSLIMGLGSILVAAPLLSGVHALLGTVVMFVGAFVLGLFVAEFFIYTHKSTEKIM